ncbi:MAG: glycosyltransferase, partial [Bacteroidales bacterium]|nr:glycosyltransferase [Bacteroidales bacterium]MDD4218400.1 glycosyltransferase [Bacteroidales bacterium]
MKRILIDLNKLSNLNCGLGQVALNFGKTLSEVETNLELNYLVPTEYVGFFGNKINYYTSKSIADVKNEFNLWHCIHQEPLILPNDSTKLLITIHDLNFLGEKNNRKAAKRLKKLQTLVNRADKLTFISEFSKKVALNNLKYDKDKTFVIYNGVNTSLEEEKPKVHPDKFFFSIGVFKLKKNFHVLIPVMKHFPEYKFIIAGDTTGKYYKNLKKLVNKHNLENQILFPGIISEQEKTWYYRNCEAFLFP